MLENNVFRTKFAEDIFNNKYAHKGCETWERLSEKLIINVCGDILSKDEVEELIGYHSEMKFIAGGRYLYYANRKNKFYNNCYLLKSEEDSREDWANLSWKAESCLMTGGGIGNDYSIYRPKGSLIKKTGGQASGPIPKMYMINEIGRNVMQGGARRSAIYASLNWRHGDIDDFLHVKDWYSMPVSGAYDNNGNNITIGFLKEKDFNYPAALDMTNISINYDNKFLETVYDIPIDRLEKKLSKDNNLEFKYIPLVFLDNCRQAMKTGEPGFSFNFYDAENETLRNACQPSYAKLLTPDGIKTLGEINIGDTIWSGFKWTKVVKKWSTGVKPVYQYRTTTGNFIGTENHRIVQNGNKIEVKEAESIDWSVGECVNNSLIDLQDVMDGLVIGDGSVHKASNNLVYLCTEEKDYDYFIDPISKLFLKSREGLSKGAYEIKTTINSNELPKTYLRTVPDRFYYGNSNVKCGFLRGLFSANGSISGNRVSLKQSSKQLIIQVQEMLSSLGIHSYITVNKPKLNKFRNGEYWMKESYDLNITSGRSIFRDNIGFIQKYKQESIIDGGKIRYKTSNIKDIEYLEDVEVFEITVEDSGHTYWTGGCLVSNCTEVTSEDDSDVCNLASINLSRINSIKELTRICYLASKFLYCGTLKADLPYTKIKEVREKNRRLGLGLMGIHEWLLQRGYDYSVNEELRDWLEVYRQYSESGAIDLAEKLDMNIPKAFRAIAPTGTIGILAGTTTGIEPLFAVAYKRRYLKDGDSWHYQYVVDGTAKLLVDKYNIEPDSIETALSLANNYEKRIKFQADIQDYVDMSISSTINIPKWGTELNNSTKVNKFAKTLLKYAHRLRGFTCYPDGSRGGQPLTSIKYEEAIKYEGKEFKEEFHDICEIGGKGGTCGV